MAFNDGADDSTPGQSLPAALAIWRDHFHLAADPFALTPDPSLLFLSEEHAEALAALKLGLLGGRGLVVLIGEVGTGKTTVAYSLLSSLDRRIETAYVSNTALSFEELLIAALKDFGVTPAGCQRIDLLDAFNGFLCRCAEQDKTAALVVDEAQNLSDETFEQLRLLLNFETRTKKLLQILMIGQPELADRLADPRLRQIADRIAIRYHLDPLSRQDARGYLAYRLEAAGGGPQIFTRAAESLLVRKSRGFPRRLNVLGHNAMLFAYGRGCARVDRSHVARAVRETAGKSLVRLRHPGIRHGKSSELLASFLISWKARLGAAAAFVLVLAVTLALPPAAVVSRDLPASSTLPANDTASVTATEALPSPATAAAQHEAPSAAAAALPGAIAESVSTAGRPAAAGSARVTANLRLRAGPGPEHPTLRTLPRDTSLEVLDRRGDWLRVRPPGEEGWVARDYVALAAEALASTGSTANLRLRAGPGLEHPTIRTLSPDASLEILDRRDGWLAVRLPGEEGWVARDYVALAAEALAAGSEERLSSPRRGPAPP